MPRNSRGEQNQVASAAEVSGSKLCHCDRHAGSRRMSNRILCSKIYTAITITRASIGPKIQPSSSFRRASIDASPVCGNRWPVTPCGWRARLQHSTAPLQEPLAKRSGTGNQMHTRLRGEEWKDQARRVIPAGYYPGSIGKSITCAGHKIFLQPIALFPVFTRYLPTSSRAFSSPRP